MESREYSTRYLHIAGAFGVGGTLTKIHPEVGVHVPIPVVAAVHLPMVGGVSEAKSGKQTVDCKKVKFGPINRELLNQLREKELLSVRSAASLARSEPEVQGKPFGSHSMSEVKAVRIEGFFLKYCLLNLHSSHDPANGNHPRVTFGDTEITGLKLGKSELKITLDVDTLNKYPTLDEFELAVQNDKKLREAISHRFVIDPETGGFHKNRSGYVVGSIVKDVQGLPPGATKDNAYTINWPGFGKIILGEVLLGAHVRRATLVRLKHSDIEIGSGCSGGSTYP